MTASQIPQSSTTEETILFEGEPLDFDPVPVGNDATKKLKELDRRKIFWARARDGKIYCYLEYNGATVQLRGSNLDALFSYQIRDINWATVTEIPVDPTGRPLVPKSVFDRFKQSFASKMKNAAPAQSPAESDKSAVPTPAAQQQQQQEAEHPKKRAAHEQRSGEAAKKQKRAEAEPVATAPAVAAPVPAPAPAPVIAHVPTVTVAVDGEYAFGFEGLIVGVVDMLKAMRETAPTDYERLVDRANELRGHWQGIELERLLTDTEVGLYHWACCIVLSAAFCPLKTVPVSQVSAVSFFSLLKTPAAVTKRAPSSPLPAGLRLREEQQHYAHIKRCMALDPHGASESFAACGKMIPDAADWNGAAETLCKLYPGMSSIEESPEDVRKLLQDHIVAMVVDLFEFTF